MPIIVKEGELFFFAKLRKVNLTLNTNGLVNTKVKLTNLSGCLCELACKFLNRQKKVLYTLKDHIIELYCIPVYINKNQQEISTRIKFICKFKIISAMKYILQ